MILKHINNGPFLREMNLLLMNLLHHEFTAWERASWIYYLNKLWRFVTKYHKMCTWNTQSFEVCEFCILLYYAQQSGNNHIRNLIIAFSCVIQKYTIERGRGPFPHLVGHDWANTNALPSSSPWQAKWTSGAFGSLSITAFFVASLPINGVAPKILAMRFASTSACGRLSRLVGFPTIKALLKSRASTFFSLSVVE